MKLPPDFSKARVLVAGDVMLDSYGLGSTFRISPEVPVPFVQMQQQEEQVSGAGNAAINVEELGVRVCPMGLVGQDDAAIRLDQLLVKHAVEPDFIVLSGAAPLAGACRDDSVKGYSVRIRWL